MDKGRKLRRYNRKDYTELVEFPVEIVGRDGAVRHYSFQEAVRLYQRRVSSAPQRYDDRELIEAEKRHCKRRIDQLRRSYFARYGWEALKAPGGGRLSAAQAAEVAAFLRTCLGGNTAEIESLKLSFLDADGECLTYFVAEKRGLLGTGSSLLYLHAFDEAGTGRERFFAYLKLLQSVQAGGAGTENLVAFHHTADCGLILTTEDPNPPLATAQAYPDPLLPEDARQAPAPLRDAFQLLRAGREVEALDQMEAAYTEHRYLRHAYLGAAVIADLLGAHDRAETAALMGNRYFPDDGLMAYHLAVAHIRLGAPERARPLMEVVSAAPGGQRAVALLEALVALDAGALSRARHHLSAVLRTGGRAHVVAHSDLLHAARVLQLHLALRTFGALLALMVTTAGLGLSAAAQEPTPTATGLVVLGALSLPLGWWWWDRRRLRLLRGPGRRHLRLASLGILQDPGRD